MVSQHLSGLLGGFVLAEEAVRFKGKCVSLHYYSDAIILVFRIISVQNNIVKYGTSILHLYWHLYFIYLHFNNVKYSTCLKAKITFREK